MRRGVLISLAVALGASLVVAGALWAFLRSEVIQLDDRFYVLLGGGGNTAILIAEDGALVVDTKFAFPGRQLARTVAAVTDVPVKLIVNTHYHFGHSHGNINFPADSGIIAQRRTRRHMIELGKRFWEYEPAWSMLPQDLVDDGDERVIDFGDETVRILHPGRGHTDGDVVVHFVRRGIVHTGDLFVHGMLPYIDRRAGGSGVEWPGTLDRVLGIEPATRYIPGHGPLAARADVERFRDYLRALVAQVEEQAAGGRSLREIRGSIDLGAFDNLRGVPFFTSHARNVEWIYEEVTARQR